jgi:hypothetical protein
MLSPRPSLRAVRPRAHCIACSTALLPLPLAPLITLTCVLRKEWQAAWWWWWRAHGHFGTLVKHVAHNTKQWHYDMAHRVPSNRVNTKHKSAR